MQLANHSALMAGGPRVGPCLRNRNLSPGLPGALFGPDRPWPSGSGPSHLAPGATRDPAARTRHRRTLRGSGTAPSVSISCSKHSGDSTVCLTLQQNLEFARSSESIN